MTPFARDLVQFLAERVDGAVAPARRFWTDVEVQRLREQFADTPTRELAQALRRSENQILAKANSLGLHKSRELIAQMARERTARPDHGGRATRFQPGIVPANKGLRRPGFAPGDMARTQFKPGCRPHTWVPVGSVVVNADGVLDRKVNDDPGPRHVRWKPVTRLVWEAAHGPIPSGQVVVFRPGLASVIEAEITLDRLELLTRAELMARNTIHNLPAPLADVARLRGRLTRAINDRAKELEPHA